MIKTKSKFPIWFMRQSGRYLPEYLNLRQKYSFIDILNQPELIVYLTTLPLKYFDIDALIIFSDISVPFSLMEGVEFDIVDSKGPIARINNYYNIKVNQTSQILENIKKAIQVIKKDYEKTLIGFTGGIYTTFQYLTSKNKALLYKDNGLLFSIFEAIYRTIQIQIEAGVDVIQIFDTYLFDLSPLDIQFFVLPFYKILLNKIKQEYGVPIIFFCLKTIYILDYTRELKIDCLSVDWTKDIGFYFESFGGYIQGNFDPYILTIEDKEDFEKISQMSLIRIFQAIEEPNNLSRYIFNLGHGLLPNTKVDNLKRLIYFLRN
ncbi:MAG: uroporphyrinogen decarboxylase family protein [bacterium]